MEEGPDGLPHAMGVGHILFLGAADEVEDVLLGWHPGDFAQAPAWFWPASEHWHADRTIRYHLPVLFL